MQLRSDIAERTNHMVGHCRLDSTSFFLTQRGTGVPDLMHLHHVGVSEEE